MRRHFLTALTLIFRTYWPIYAFFVALTTMSVLFSNMGFDQVWRLVALMIVFTAATSLDLAEKLSEQETPSV